MSSAVIFAMTAGQARALIELYEGSRARIPLRVQAGLIVQGLAEQSGGPHTLALTPVGYHAARLALALPTPWADADEQAEQASLLPA